jgi:ubiquinone/menaquinone biosynthesis C-methylase UbiE
MSPASPHKSMRNLPRRLANSRLFWDYIMGPDYNKNVLRIQRDIYSLFVDTVVEKGEVPAHTRILDVGSGPGLLTSMLAEKYPDTEVVGVDFSPRQVQAANRLLSHSQLVNCSFKVGDAVDLPFEDGSFDLVVSTFSISSWPDMQKGLEEIRRVLVADGKACIVDADSSSTEEEIRRFTMGYASTGANRRLNEWITRRFVFGPAIAITSQKAAALAESAGFSLVSVEKQPGLPFFRLKLHSSTRARKGQHS